MIERHEKVLVRLTESIEGQNENFSFTKNKIDVIGSDLALYRSELKENIEPPKPIRANNWNSVREAFKGPVKVEVNERN